MLLKQFYNNFRLFNEVRYRITPSRIKKGRGALLFDDSKFYRLNINCRGDAYYGYVNIEEIRTKGRIFVSSLSRLPFSDNEAKVIFFDFATVRKGQDLFRIFKEWARVMVPNGILTIDNIEVTPEICSILERAGFEQVFLKHENRLPVAYFVNSAKEEFYSKTEFYYTEKENCLTLSRDNLENSKMLRFENLNLPEEGLDEIKLIDVLEYLPSASIESALLCLKKSLRPGGRLEILVKNECFLESAKYISFFDKGNLVQYLTETDFSLERLELQGDFIKAVAKKKLIAERLGIKIGRKKRICAIGQYMISRYNQLGFGWDEIPRAMDKLGIDYLLVEGMRNIDPGALHKAILSYRPDYVLLILKETIPILFDITAELKKIGTKVIFWFCDPEHPPKRDLSSVIDAMFLSNRGQLDEYRQAYNIKRVYYMPQGSSPYIMYHRDIPEIYDIGFTGALSKARLHNTRREFFEELAKKYVVCIRNNVRNNVAEFYSQSKIVLGGSDFDYELYTSNRFFVTLGCGACYITKRFKGIELLAENKKHVLWFQTREELFEIIDYYLRHDAERTKIRNAAERLALEKHTYEHRLKNILDIVDGKTESFYGFL